MNWLYGGRQVNIIISEPAAGSRLMRCNIAVFQIWMSTCAGIDRRLFLTFTRTMPPYPTLPRLIINQTKCNYARTVRIGSEKEWMNIKNSGIGPSSPPLSFWKKSCQISVLIYSRLIHTLAAAPWLLMFYERRNEIIFVFYGHLKPFCWRLTLENSH